MNSNERIENSLYSSTGVDLAQFRVILTFLFPASFTFIRLLRHTVWNWWWQFVFRHNTYDTVIRDKRSYEVLKLLYMRVEAQIVLSNLGLYHSQLSIYSTFVLGLHLTWDVEYSDAKYDHAYFALELRLLSQSTTRVGLAQFLTQIVT